MTSTRRRITALALAALAAAIGLAAANLFLGDLNQDEGWYLYAARLVSRGQWPYVHFAFSQGPVMPLVYAWGLAGGRLATALLGLAAALLAARLAARLAPAGGTAGAALVAFSLTAVNVYQSYYFTVVKTYALTACWLLLGLHLLLSGWSRARGGVLALAGAFLVLAAGTRSSAAVALPLAVLFLMADRRRAGPMGWLHFGWGAALAAVLLFGPFLLQAPEALVFWVAVFHTARDGGTGLAPLLYKAGFGSRLLQAYFPAFALGLALLAAPRPDSDSADPADARVPFQRLLWILLAGVTLVHGLAPFPYDDYQVFVYPVLAALLAGHAVRRIGPARSLRLAVLLLALCLGAALSSPMNQDWFIQGRDRIWWRAKEKTPLRALQDTARQIRAWTRPGDQLLTQDPYLAVESRLDLPPGLEMGQFSYFPGLDDRRADALHVLNRATLERLLKTTDAPVAALSGYALAIASPAVTPLDPADASHFLRLVEARYEPVSVIPSFGQAYTTLTLYRLRPRETPGVPPASPPPSAEHRP